MSETQNTPENKSQEIFDVFSLATDEKLECDGIWHNIGHNARVRVARWNNDEYQRMMRRKFKANKLSLEADDDYSDDLSKEILQEVMAHTILKDIEGIGFKGQLIERYTPAIGMQLLQVKDFRDRIRALAEESAQFRLKQEDEAVKS